MSFSSASRVNDVYRVFLMLILSGRNVHWALLWLVGFSLSRWVTGGLQVG